MLLISCYILYAFHLHILVIYFSLSYNVLVHILSSRTLYFSYTVIYSSLSFSYTFIYHVLFTSCSCNCILSSHSCAMLLIYCTFHILSYCTFKCILSSHSSVMLLISCHIFYIYHFLLGFMSAYTLEADMGNNCMYP